MDFSLKGISAAYNIFFGNNPTVKKEEKTVSPTKSKDCFKCNSAVNQNHSNLWNTSAPSCNHHGVKTSIDTQKQDSIKDTIKKLQTKYNIYE